MSPRGGIELRKRPGEGYIAFVGNYLPRQCGIATFTTDLCEAVAEEAAGADSIADERCRDLEHADPCDQAQVAGQGGLVAAEHFLQGDRH